METIEIKTYNGTTIKTVAVSVDAESHETLMADDYITLVWNDEAGDELPAGAYVIDGNGEKYALLDPYTPEQVSEGEWRYQPQFSSRVAAWAKVPYFHYTRIGSTVTNREPDWTLTDTAENFIKNIAAAITEETGEYWTGESSFELSGIQNISFQSTDIFSGLNAIADAFETEWLADKSTNTVYLGKAMFTGASTPTLEVGVNINVPSVTLNKEGFYNRFVVFGSTRNITQDYEGANVNNLVNKRLTLNPTQYPGSVIDRRTSASEPKLTKILIFDDIYPRSNLVVIDARPRLMYTIKKGTTDEKVQIGTDSEGEPIYDQYAIWYLQLGTKDYSGNVTPFRLANKQPYNKDNPDGVLIQGKNLSIHFSSGALNGREFEVQYHEDNGKVESFDGAPFEVKEGDFEITYTEDNNFIVPAMAGSVPDDGDKVILFNLRMPSEYTAEAYAELKQAADITIAEYESDRNNYEFDSNPVEFNGNAALLGLRVGQKVIYQNGDYSYVTRILSITKKLDHPFEQTIKVGNDRIKGDTRTLKEEVANANKDINLIASFNQLTQSTINNYNKMLTEITAGFERIKDMWRFDPEHPDVIFTKYTAYSLKDLQAFGYSNNGEGDGEGGGNGGAVFNLLLNWNDYTSDKDNNYAISAKLGHQLYYDLTQLQADALTRAVADTLYQPKGDYALSTDLTAIDQRLTDFLDGTDTDTIINRWKELKAFLSGLSQTDNLAAILSNKVDKVDGYGLSKNDFTDALLEKLNGIEDGANNYTLPAATATTLGGIMVGDTLSIASSVLNLKSGIVTTGTYAKVTVDTYGRVTAGAALTASDIPSLAISKITGLQTALDAKLDKNEFEKWFEIVYDADGQTILYIKTPHTFVSEKDLQAFGYDNQSGSQFSAALADLTDVTLSNPSAGQVLVYNGSKWVNQAINVSGGLDETQLANYLTTNNYAKKSDIPSLSGYATQSWVTSQNYLTSHQPIRTLTIQKNGTTVDTFDPTATANKTIDITDVASAATLSSHIGNTTIHITADERTLWNKTATDLASIWGTDSDMIINKWQEVVNFLSGMGETDRLALILAGKADKTELDDYLKISEFEKYFKAIKNADGSFSYILTQHTLVSEKDLQAFGQSDTQGGSGTAAIINLLDSWDSYSDATKGYAPTAEIVKAALDSKLGASALSGYATQDWVSQNYVTKGSLNFNDINDSAIIYVDANTIVRRTIITRAKNAQGYVSRVALGLTNPSSAFSPAIISVGLNDAGTSWRDFTFKPDGSFIADKIVKSGGTSSQFLMADGSVDSNKYIPYSTVSLATVNGTNNNPQIFNIENENLISGYSTFWSVINLGSYSHGDFRSQIAMPYASAISDTDMFIRTANSSTWRSWRRVLHDGNYASILDGHFVTRNTEQTINAKKYFTTPIGLGTVSADWNVARMSDSLSWLKSDSPASANSPGTWYSGVSFMTSYVGFQLAIHGSDNEEFKFRKISDGNSWTAWREILHTGNYTTTLDARYVKKSGDTMTGALGVRDYMVAKIASGANKAAFGYSDTQGAYLYNYAKDYYLGIKDNGTPHFNGNTLWHSGNDGSGSGLDADLLDGYHATRFTDYNSNLNGNNVDFNTISYARETAITIQPIHVPNYTGVLNTPLNGYGQMLTFGGYSGFFPFRIAYFQSPRLYVQGAGYKTAATFDFSAGSDWKSIAFTTDNVASATRLQTNSTYTAWGQTFFANGVPQSVNGVFRELVAYSLNGGVAHSILNHPDSPYGLITRIYGNGSVSLQAQRETTTSEYFPLLLNPLGGNVAVGKTTADYKLDVNGTAKVTTLKIGDATFTYNSAGYILCDKTIVSSADIQAFGAGSTSGGGGAAAFNLLSSWSGTYDNSYALAASLGVNLNNRLTTVEGSYLSTSAAASLYQPKGNYLTSITKSQVEAVLTGNITSHHHCAVAHIDRRSTNPLPFAADFAIKGIENALKSNTTDGLSDGGTFHSAMTIHPWNDSSGGAAHQLGFTDNGNIYHRYGTSSWSAWDKLLTVLNYTATLDARYVKKSGDTMTGALGVRDYMVAKIASGANKAAFGYSDTQGAYLYNYAKDYYLGIKDNGTPHFNGNTLWHSGNDGSGSGLDADLLDGYHETAFFIQNRGKIPTAYIDITDYNPGAAAYANYASGTYQITRVGYSELFVNLANTNNGSTSALQFKTSYVNTDNLYFRKTIDSNRVSGAWTTILTNLNIGSHNAGSATKLQTARSINGTSFDGTAAITTAKWGTARTIWINDYDSQNWGTATGIDGSGNINLYLPSDCGFNDLHCAVFSTSDATFKVTSTFRKDNTAAAWVTFEPQTNGNLNIIGHTSAGANPSIGAFNPSSGQLSLFKLYIGTSLNFDATSSVTSDMAFTAGKTLWLNTARTVGFRLEGNVVRLIGATLIADKDIQAFSV